MEICENCEDCGKEIDDPQFCGVCGDGPFCPDCLRDHETWCEEEI